MSNNDANASWHRWWFHLESWWSIGLLSLITTERLYYSNFNWKCFDTSHHHTIWSKTTFLIRKIWFTCHCCSHGNWPSPVMYRLHPSPSMSLLAASVCSHYRQSGAVRGPTVAAASSLCVVSYLDTIDGVRFHCRLIHYFLRLTCASRKLFGNLSH